MNLGELIEEINKDLDDTIDSDELITWINRCMEDLSAVANYQKVQSYNLITGQKLYTLPTDYMETIQVVDDVAGFTLPRLPLQNLRRYGYKLVTEQLIIQPTPTQDYTVDLYYQAKLPYLVELEDTPVINSSFHEMFVLYTVAKYNYKDEEEPRQMNAWNEYQTRKAEFVRFVNKSPIEPIRDVYRVGAEYFNEC